MNEKLKKTLKWVGIYAAVTLIAFLIYYVTLPAINLKSEGFWVFLTVLAILYTLPLSGLKMNVEVLKRDGEFKLHRPKKKFFVSGFSHTGRGCRLQASVTWAKRTS